MTSPMRTLAIEIGGQEYEEALKAAASRAGVSPETSET